MIICGSIRPRFSAQMKRDASFFQDGRAELIYIAKRLKESLRLESVLTEAGVDYGVEPDTYRGAFFYVMPEVLEIARRVMREHGYRPHEDRV